MGNRERNIAGWYSILLLVGASLFSVLRFVLLCFVLVPYRFRNDTCFTTLSELHHQELTFFLQIRRIPIIPRT